MTSNGGQDVKQPKSDSSHSEGTPEEQQLQHDLDHLALLLIRCRQIRTTIPRMLGGMPDIARNHQDSPEIMFGELVNHMKSAGAEIEDFATLYTSQESKKILEKANKSRAANPKGIETWLYEKHSDWAESPH